MYHTGRPGPLDGVAHRTKEPVDASVMVAAASAAAAAGSTVLVVMRYLLLHDVMPPLRDTRRLNRKEV